MILGIGVDITDSGRMARLYEMHGERLLGKFLTASEKERMPVNPRNFLASRFAAKEAAVKALGTGFSGGIGPGQIEIAADEGGQPLLLFHGKARERAMELGVARAHLSISHERSCAVAIVVLEN